MAFGTGAETNFTSPSGLDLPRSPISAAELFFSFREFAKSMPKQNSIWFCRVTGSLYGILHFCIQNIGFFNAGAKCCTCAGGVVPVITAESS
jgi:hypothetical protein